MTMRRFILEMGAGNDLHGGDYTKAAVRAVEDALHHSSLNFLGSLGWKSTDMDVRVTIGVQAPQAVDIDRVTAALPRGRATVRAVRGGLDIADESGADPAVIASAAIEVWMDVPG